MDFLNYIYILPEQMFLELTQEMISTEKLDWVFSYWSMLNLLISQCLVGNRKHIFGQLMLPMCLSINELKETSLEKKSSICMCCIIIGEFICEAGIYELSRFKRIVI